MNPIRPVDELLVLKDKTPSARGEDGAKRLVELVGLHNDSIKSAAYELLDEAMDESARRVLAGVSPTYTVPDSIIAKLREYDEQAAPPPRDQVTTWILADTHIYEMEALRAQVGWLWNTATLAYEIYRQELGDVQLFVQQSSVADKEADKQAEVRQHTSSAVIVMENWETARDYGRRLYERISAMIESMHRITQRQFASSSYASMPVGK